MFSYLFTSGRKQHYINKKGKEFSFSTRGVGPKLVSVSWWSGTTWNEFLCHHIWAL